MWEDGKEKGRTPKLSRRGEEKEEERRDEKMERKPVGRGEMESLWKKEKGK